MAKNKLFQELNLAHNPKRNGYDLGFRMNFTAKAGELLPVMHRTVMPGEQFKLRVSHFTRTAPLNTAAQTKIKEYFDFFFVPYRLLWKDAPAVHTNNQQNPVTATSLTTNRSIGTSTPHFDFTSYRSSGLSLLGQLTDNFGYNRAYRSAKLMNHLGYTYISEDHIKSAISGTTLPEYKGPQYLSAYPLLAYQCIYYNFYRNSQWENNQPYNYNVDYLGSSALLSPEFSLSSAWASYWHNPTLFDLHYSNYPKDLFFGVFPDAQFGDSAIVEIAEQSADSGTNPDGLYPIVDSSGNEIYTSQSFTVNTDSGTPDTMQVVAFNSSITDETSQLYAKLGDIERTLRANFSILELRKAQFLQKYKEIIGSGRNDYKARIQKIFGVDVPDNIAQIPIYLGGRSSEINVQEVTNTNLTDGNDPEIKANGTGSSESDLIEFEVPAEHGIIMCIYHCQPVVDYALNALHFDVVKTEYDDYANPIFDQLGFEELPSYFLDASLAYEYDYTSSDVRYSGVNNLGYTTRYFDYKTSVDMTIGDFRESRTNWLAPVNLDYLKNYYSSNGRLYVNANFFRVNPAILDSIFTLQASPTTNTSSGNSVNSDQFLVWANFEIQAVRPLDYNGVPY